MQFEKALKLVGLAEGGIPTIHLIRAVKQYLGLRAMQIPIGKAWKMIDLWKSRGITGKALDKLAKNDTIYGT